MTFSEYHEPLTASDLLLSGWNSDFTVVFGDASRRLHRKILGSHSGFFRSMFSVSPEEDRVDFTDHHLVDEKTFDLLIKTWYRGKRRHKFRVPEAFDLVELREHLWKISEYLSCDVPELLCKGPLLDREDRGLLVKDLDGITFMEIGYDEDRRFIHTSSSRWYYEKFEEGQAMRKRHQEGHARLIMNYVERAAKIPANKVPRFSVSVKAGFTDIDNFNKDGSLKEPLNIWPNPDCGGEPYFCVDIRINDSFTAKKLHFGSRLFSGHDLQETIEDLLRLHLND